jgi:hypothetical protein
VQTNAPFTSPLLFQDTQAATYKARFYRVLMHP